MNSLCKEKRNIFRFPIKDCKNDILDLYIYRKIIHFGFILIILFLHLSSGLAQTVNFESSNLPIIVINTNGQTIPDEPKITAHMGIISNNEGGRNYLTDSFNEYDGFIGIELRGNSSQTWPKKPYGIETRDASGENNNVSIFGMPEENDWVLHAPYADKTLIRNVLMYRLAAELGWYAPRTQFCELVLNGEYIGVFLFIEKIKRDKNRVNISKPDNSDLSGGYLLEMVVNDELKDPVHFRLQQSGKEMVVKYPKQEDMSAERLNWISDYLNTFEGVLNNGSYDEILQYIDISSFIDHMLLSEGFHQFDAYTKSQFFYKDKKDILFSGPGWDYNRCIGNIVYYNSWSPTIWWLKAPMSSDPESWYRINWPALFMAHPEFMKAYAQRWIELRQSTFSYDFLFSFIDDQTELLTEARVRNFERWPVLGVSISNKYVFDTYEEEISYMKDWIQAKFSWLDEQFDQSENYAFNNLMNYSSQEPGDLNPASHAVDGDETTRWSAQAFPQWIEVDLGQKRQINKVVLMPYNDRAYRYTVEAKADDWEEYTTIIDRSQNTEGNSELSDSFKQINVRYLRLTVSGATSYSGDWCSILEFKVHGPAQITSIEELSFKQKSFYLSPAYPNPFNPTTTISYSLSQSGYMELAVYDIMGKKVKTLVKGFESPGSYSVVWDGLNERGEQTASGLFLYRLTTKAAIQTEKMILLR